MNRSQWTTIASNARHVVGPWVDPKTRRPLVTLAVAAMAIVLGPLAVDVGKALIFRDPWIRWSLGEGVFLAILGVGLRRLWRVFPTDSWPAIAVPDESGGKTAEARWVPWALRLAVAALVVPIMRNPDGLGFGDWDFLLDKFEALRRTVLVLGTIPLVEPLVPRRFPVGGRSSGRRVSIATPLVLALGTTIGLGVSTIVCICDRRRGGVSARRGSGFVSPGRPLPRP